MSTKYLYLSGGYPTGKVDDSSVDRGAAAAAAASPYIISFFETSGQHDPRLEVVVRSRVTQSVGPPRRIAYRLGRPASLGPGPDRRPSTSEGPCARTARRRLSTSENGSSRIPLRSDGGFTVGGMCRDGLLREVGRARRYGYSRRTVSDGEDCNTACKKIRRRPSGNARTTVLSGQNSTRLRSREH